MPTISKAVFFWKLYIMSVRFPVFFSFLVNRSFRVFNIIFVNHSEDQLDCSVSTLLCASLESAALP